MGGAYFLPPPAGRKYPPKPRLERMGIRSAAYRRLLWTYAGIDTDELGGITDEAEFSRVLHHDRRIEHSLRVFRAVRASPGELFDHMGDGDWSRAGTHSESGRYSVEDWLRIYANHAEAHADQIRRARVGQA